MILINEAMRLMHAKAKLSFSIVVLNEDHTYIGELESKYAVKI